jgi:hypothetical protein
MDILAFLFLALGVLFCRLSCCAASEAAAIAHGEATGKILRAQKWGTARINLLIGSALIALSPIIWARLWPVSLSDVGPIYGAPIVFLVLVFGSLMVTSAFWPTRKRMER